MSKFQNKKIDIYFIPWYKIKIMRICNIPYEDLHFIKIVLWKQEIYIIKNKLMHKKLAKIMLLKALMHFIKLIEREYNILKIKTNIRIY